MNRETGDWLRSIAPLFSQSINGWLTMRLAIIFFTLEITNIRMQLRISNRSRACLFEQPQHDGDITAVKREYQQGSSRHLS
jgi:hypothetical protein